MNRSQWGFSRLRRNKGYFFLNNTCHALTKFTLILDSLMTLSDFAKGYFVLFFSFFLQYFPFQLHNIIEPMKGRFHSCVYVVVNLAHVIHRNWIFSLNSFKLWDLLIKNLLEKELQAKGPMNWLILHWRAIWLKRCSLSSSYLLLLV